jgi:hypothetical protein
MADILDKICFTNLDSRVLMESDNENQQFVAQGRLYYSGG